MYDEVKRLEKENEELKAKIKLVISILEFIKSHNKIDQKSWVLTTIKNSLELLKAEERW